LREAKPGATGLEKVCGVGLEALRSLGSASPPADGVLASWPMTLKEAAEPNLSASMIAIIPSIALLAEASAHQSERSKLSDDAWSELLTQAAAPK
jgi:hypothetical protein